MDIQRAQMLDLNNVDNFARHSKSMQTEAARDFEAMFIQSTLKEMRPNLEGGLFNDGLAVDMFYQFMDEAIAKNIANSDKNFGLADQLIKENF